MNRDIVDLFLKYMWDEFRELFDDEKIRRIIYGKDNKPSFGIGLPNDEYPFCKELYCPKSVIERLEIVVIVSKLFFYKDKLTLSQLCQLDKKDLKRYLKNLKQHINKDPDIILFHKL